MVQPQHASRLWRALFYGIGVTLLALGITLNTKTGLGVSPITSIPYSISEIWDLSFAVLTFIVYSILVGGQFLLKGKKRDWLDILQIPFSFVFSVLLDLFERALPFSFSHLWQNLIMLAFAIVFTAIGIALTVGMKLIPNPADGFAKTLGDVLGKGVGFGKNIADVISVTITAAISLIASGRLVGIGPGTILAMIFVGRVVALFNRLFEQRLLTLAGLQNPETPLNRVSCQESLSV